MTYRAPVWIGLLVTFGALACPGQGSAKTCSGDVPPPLYAPIAASTEHAAEVVQSSGNFTFINFGSVADSGGNKDAQTAAYTSNNKRVVAGLQRVENASGNYRDVASTLSVAYDNCANLRLSGGVGADRGTHVDAPDKANFTYYSATYYGGKGSLDARWEYAGEQYNPSIGESATPGVAGFRVQGEQQVGAASITSMFDRYRDLEGNLVQMEQQVRASIPLLPGTKLEASTGSRYAEGWQRRLMPDNHNGVALDTRMGNAASADVSFEAGRFEDGFLQRVNLRSALSLGGLNSIQLSRGLSDFRSDAFGQSLQLSSSAELVRRLRAGGSIRLGYRFVSGAPPGLLARDGSQIASIEAAFEKPLPIGTLEVTYSDPNTLFPAPNFSIALRPLP